MYYEYSLCRIFSIGQGFSVPYTGYPEHGQVGKDSISSY